MNKQAATGVHGYSGRVDHDHACGDTIWFTQEFWDDRYRSADELWSGQPNPQLVAQTADLTPGEALEVGSGEGADAIWLARQGWTVTAVDVSTVALERAADHAAAQGEGIARRITWRHEDMRSWDPGTLRFDLVSAQYMYLPGGELKSMHQRLGAAVRRGGTLLVVSHHPDDLRAKFGPAAEAHAFPSAEQLAASFDPGDWEILVTSADGRSAADPEGRPVTVRDSVLRAVRRVTRGS
jgi:SAM-dependent methyltransferase